MFRGTVSSNWMDLKVPVSMVHMKLFYSCCGNLLHYQGNSNWVHRPTTQFSALHKPYWSFTGRDTAVVPHSGGDNWIQMKHFRDNPLQRKRFDCSIKVTAFNCRHSSRWSSRRGRALAKWGYLNLLSLLVTQIWNIWTQFVEWGLKFTDLSD